MGNAKANCGDFDVNSQAITKHIKNIHGEKELEENLTCSILEQVGKEGNRAVKCNVEYYKKSLSMLK